MNKYADSYPKLDTTLLSYLSQLEPKAYKDYIEKVGPKALTTQFLPSLGYVLNSKSEAYKEFKQKVKEKAVTEKDVTTTIDGGTCSRGYHWIMRQDDDYPQYTIEAGCRMFSFSSAMAHWWGKDYTGPREEVQAIIRRLCATADALGWKWNKDKSFTDRCQAYDEYQRALLEVASIPTNPSTNTDTLPTPAHEDELERELIRDLLNSYDKNYPKQS